MRRFLIPLALLAAPLLFAQSSKTPPLEVRSPHHLLTVEFAQASGDELEYLATVRDLDHDKVIVEKRIKAHRGETAESVTSVDGDDVRIKIASFGARFSAALEMRRDGKVVDFASSTTGPARERMTSGVVGPLRVGGDVKAPVVIRRVEPMYPEEARAARVSGIVIVETTIDTNGVVRNAVVLKDLPYGLGDAALAAVKQWTFKPGTIEGKTVDVIFNLTINFKLDGSEPPPPPQ
jgi:protein TonB